MAKATVSEVLRLERMGNPFIAARMAVQLTEDEIAYCIRRVPYDDRAEFERCISKLRADT